MPAGRTGGDHDTSISLFVVWSAGRSHDERIVADLRQRFTIIGMYEIHWTPSRVRRNYERFYSDLEVRGVYHLQNKGAGQHLAILVIDRQPAFEDRMTSRGIRFVNSRYLDAKERYRSWTGEFTVHCTETDHETARDLMMMIGIDLETLETHQGTVASTSIEVLHRDLTGAGGWSSESQLFDMLNRAVGYVVLDEPSIDHSRQIREGEPMRLLTDDCAKLVRILDARPTLSSIADRCGIFVVRIRGHARRVEVREIGDAYIDPRWARECLERRVFDQTLGHYRTERDDAIAILAYDALVYRRSGSSDAARRIVSLLDPEVQARHRGSETALLQEHLARFLQSRGYAQTRPRDPTLTVKNSGTSSSSSGFRRSGDAVRRAALWGSRGSRNLVMSSYLRLRDRIVLRAPWIRRLRSRIR